ncbi:MAG: Rpn family recombination-promoting nuclease/putative transposase [Mariprofundales bacterium]
MCHINPRVDFAFKKLFGSEENKDLLIALINSIVDEADQVVSLTLRNPYNLAAYQAGKMSVLDIKAVDKNGCWFNVEMQMCQDLYFDKRALYYWAKLLTEQLGEGMIYNQLHKTISINILNFDFLRKNSNDFHNRYHITNTTTGKHDELHDIFELHYVELPKFHKDFTELANTLDRWTIFLQRAHEIDKEKIPASLSCDTMILNAINKVDRMFNEDERKIYDVRMQNLADTASRIYSARTEGIKQGLEKGLEKGQKKMVIKASEAGMSAIAIVEMFDVPLDKIKQWLIEK